MKFGIINIGDELLAGKILNTNAYDLAQLLRPWGHEIIYTAVVGDDKPSMLEALRYLSGEPDGFGKNSPKLDYLILTGGLGPTRDDITRQVLADFLHCDLIEDPEALQALADFLKKPVDALPMEQRSQACIPSRAKSLVNPVGTACGFTASLNTLQIYSFPGVPQELKAMAIKYLLPPLQEDKVLLEKSVWTFGWSEGLQAKALAVLEIAPPFAFSSLPQAAGVKISLSCAVEKKLEKEFQNQLEGLWTKILSAIPEESLVDEHGLDLPKKVVQLLLQKKSTLALAESCTGGGLASLLTSVSGASEIFMQGFITYSNQAKTKLLGVDAQTIETYGAVSEQTAAEMAEGCLHKSKANYSCAITGIAGPNGGTAEKPVGTVYISLANAKSSSLPSRTQVHRFQFRGDRSNVRQRSCFTALNLIRLMLMDRKILGKG